MAPSRLSAQELRILLLLRDGSSSKEVAKTLAIAEKTADWHVRNILVKLEARNRAHAVAVAFSLGLLDADPIVPS